MSDKTKIQDKDGTNVQSISITLPEPLSSELDSAIKDIQDLVLQLKAKEELINKMSIEIAARIEKLKSAPKINVNPHIAKVFEDTAKDYTHLITSVIAEISGRVNQLVGIGKECSNAFGENKTEDAIRFAHMLHAEIELAKAFLKKRGAELKIIFSRFDYGFDVHIKKIQEIERYLVSNK